MGGRVTALKTEPRRRERVTVFVDGRFAFALPAMVAAKLRVGQVLTDAEMETLQEKGDAEEAYDSALGYLSYRPRSRAEIVNYLRRRRTTQIDAVVDRLDQAGLLRDEDFAQYWVENRERFRPRGPAALRYELRAKGIASDAIEQALSAIDASESAYRAAGRKARQLGHLDRATFHKKLVEYLARRGFDYQVARGTAERLWTEIGANRDSPA